MRARRPGWGELGRLRRRTCGGSVPAPSPPPLQPDRTMYDTGCGGSARPAPAWRVQARTADGAGQRTLSSVRASRCACTHRTCARRARRPQYRGHSRAARRGGGLAPVPVRGSLARAVVVESRAHPPPRGRRGADHCDDGTKRPSTLGTGFWSIQHPNAGDEGPAGERAPTARSLREGRSTTNPRHTLCVLNAAPRRPRGTTRAHRAGRRTGCCGCGWRAGGGTYLLGGVREREVRAWSGDGPHQG
jgi:hypothetical protein